MIEVNQLHQHNNWRITHAHLHEHSNQDFAEKQQNCANFTAHVHHANAEDAVNLVVSKKHYASRKPIIVATEPIHNEEGSGYKYAIDLGESVSYDAPAIQLTFGGIVHLTVTMDGTASIQVEPR